jgi:uncharacterized membrane protein
MRATRNIFVFIGLSIAAFSGSHLVSAQGELVPDTVTSMKAKVLSIEKEEVREVPGTDTKTTFQTIKVEILDGNEKGRLVTIDNDYLNLETGEVFYLTHTVSSLDDTDYYTVNDPYRLPQVLVVVGLFVVAVIVFGGKQGVRGLVSLVGSFALIFFVLLPGIMQGYSPLLVTVGVASLIIIVGSYVTHGVNRTTSAAVIGMIATVSVTGLLAYWAVHFTRLTGFGSEEAVYLNLNARGSIDILGLLLGGIIIGLLGVLYDAAIGQSVAVDELTKIAPHVSRQKIFARALRIGHEHIGALVNTLAIAYVGASLPLLLLFYKTTSAGVGQLANTEIFSTEIVRIMIGSIGLVLAVPVTTLVSVMLLVKKPSVVVGPHKISEEYEALEHVGHSHSH